VKPQREPVSVSAKNARLLLQRLEDQGAALVHRPPVDHRRPDLVAVLDPLGRQRVQDIPYPEHHELVLAAIVVVDPAARHYGYIKPPFEASRIALIYSKLRQIQVAS